MKGAPTHIVYGETVYQNTTGNAALATAGSGDVLTGIITGLLAQSYEPLNAAMLGVYVHGLTADIALPETGHQSFIASDIVHYLGKAFMSLTK
jgi:ADP-dependent NAD(P)H-hydrate dehydratase